MAVFDSAEFAEHEQVVFCRDPAVGLFAIVAIHDRSLGPAVGGCRMWSYGSEDEAIRDVLRLSRGMSYKNAMAGLAMGGGKSVILGDPRRDKSPQLLRAFGRFVNSLGGRYIAAEDVGLSVADIERVGEETEYVAGLSKGQAPSGNPSPMTALGVAAGIRAAVAHQLGRSSLRGVRVAVQGIGSVGEHLCRYLHEAGASLTVADLDAAAVARAVAHFGARAVPPKDLLAQDVDVVAPCALGAVLDDDSIPTLRAKVVAGSANNQLAEARHGAELAKRGILYAPDYVISAGGIINIAGELLGDYDRERTLAKVAKIGDTLRGIFERAQTSCTPTSVVADQLARERLDAARAS